MGAVIDKLPRGGYVPGRFNRSRSLHQKRSV